MRIRCWFVLCLLWLAALVACAPTSSDPEPNLLEKAAAEATAIVQQAQATALVLHAEATATALVQQVNAASLTPPPTHTTPAPATALIEPTPAQTAPPDVATSPADAAEGTTQATDAAVVEVLSVGFAAERGFIHVRFKAPPEIAEKWWPGNVYVVDEQTEVVYNEIPVMPKIGPLIGRPKFEGQLGYVMLVNPPPYLRSGSQVTVVLGSYEFNHVTVQ